MLRLSFQQNFVFDLRQHYTVEIHALPKKLHSVRSVLHGSVLMEVCELRQSGLTVAKHIKQACECREDRVAEIKYYYRTLGKQNKNNNSLITIQIKLKCLAPVCV